MRASQTGNIRIADPERFKRIRKGVAVELRIVARARHGTHVNETGHRADLNTSFCPCCALESKRFTPAGKTMPYKRSQEAEMHPLQIKRRMILKQESQSTVLAVGHSTRPLKTFINMLKPRDCA